VILPWAEEWAEGAIETIRAVYEEYHFTWDPEGYHADLYDVRGQYLADGHQFWVYVADGRVLGTAALEKYDLLPGVVGEAVEVEGKIRVAGTNGSVERLYVHPDGRRRGIATQLMNTVVEAARAEGVTALEVWSDKRFLSAHQLYAKLGAQQVGDRICDDPDVSPEWGLVMKL
jgi:putative acetyltransferase